MVPAECCGRLRVPLRAQALDAPQTLSPPRSDGETRQYGVGKHAVVVGAGPGGILTALLLAQRGFQVDMFERRPEPDQQEIKHGSRSIIFGLVPRGLNMLRRAGIRLPEKGADSLWLNGLAVSKGAYSNRQIDGKVTSRFNKLPGSVLLVERAALVEHMLLEMERLQPDRIKLHYGHALGGIDFERKEARFDVGGQQKVVAYDLLVGCDGRNSVVRGSLEAADPSFRHEMIVAPRWYKGFHMLPPTEGVDLGDESGITLTFNTAGRILDYNSAFWPTRRGTVTGHVSAPKAWFDRMPNTPESYRSLIEEQFPLFPKAWIPQASAQLVEARASPNGATIKCSRLHGPSTVILGDSAHGVTPATGQGCNAALESAGIFIDVLDACGGDTERAPEQFTKARLADAHALFAMDRAARDRNGANGTNFVLLATRFHLLLGMVLSKLLPFWFKGPAYAVTMTSVLPYSQIESAIRRDRNIFILLLGAIAAAILALLRRAAPVISAAFA